MSSPSAKYEIPQFDATQLVAFRKSWIATGWATCALAIITVVLRLFARATKKGSAGLDDVAIVIALLLAIGDATSNTFQTTCVAFSRCFSMASLASEELNALSLGFMRLSVCIFVLRLLPPNSKFTKYATWFAIALNIAATIMCLGAFAALNPYSSKAGRSHNISLTLNRTFTAAGVLSIFTDFITVITPIFVIRAVQMNMRTKLGACAIICLGLVTACLSVGKLIATKETDHTMPINIIRIQLLSALEQNLGIIFASCPALRQLYGYVDRRLKATGAASGGSNYISGGSSAKKPTPLISWAGVEGKPGLQSSSAITRSSSIDEDLEKRAGAIEDGSSRYWGDVR